MDTASVIPTLPVRRSTRALLNFPDQSFTKDGRLIINSPREARIIAAALDKAFPGSHIGPSDLYGAAWICTAWDLILGYFAEEDDPWESVVMGLMSDLWDQETSDTLLSQIVEEFPNREVWSGSLTPRERLFSKPNSREEVIRGMALSRLSNDNPAFANLSILFDDKNLLDRHDHKTLWKSISITDPVMKALPPEDVPPMAFLRRPIEVAPNSIKDQLLYILSKWGGILPGLMKRILGALDLIEEEKRPRFFGPGPTQKPGLDLMDTEARFSDDHDWMPRVVLMAKNVLVWMHQLSKKHDHEIRTLDQIPDEDLAELASGGFNALWLIGLWERSHASRDIKQRMGNPEAAASAYSLYGYDIARDLGGWDALHALRDKAAHHGIRLASDMVPNHVGLDSDWVRHHPEWLLNASSCPYPGYSFNGPNLSNDPGLGIWLEDHYWDKSDAAVVFKRYDFRSGQEDFIYHGNDGTTMPWNDTAQIDFLNSEAREAVIQDILHVARNFPLIRFDAAMVLARKHIRRLWYPEPGAGGAVPSRSEHAMDDQEFQAALPMEFWREVVDRVAAELPGTLLLAEAFWMMEGYFVRSLGMHRVYNSAFMNMLRDQKNAEYRSMIKETLAFDPGILQRYVNFMNNPDEDTAVTQYGKDDRYFAVCTLLATLPGLPMFGHGQLEGYAEKYGMEFTRSYHDEDIDRDLYHRHEREIYPLLCRRPLFSGAVSFRLYDLQTDHGVDENVFAYTNNREGEHCIVLVNNRWEKTSGRIQRSVPVNIGDGHVLMENLADALGIEPEGPQWILLKEELSELWYLRERSHLRDQGLELVLDGFGRQIFLSFRQEQECRDGAWARLAAELAGSGTPDPDAALQELRLRPFREALGELVGQDWIAIAASTLRNGRPPAFAKESREVPEILKRFQYADRNLYNREHHNSSDASLDVYNRVIRNACGHWKVFGSRLRRYALKRFPIETKVDSAGILVVWCLVIFLESTVKGVGCRRIWSEWGLNRWLDENWPEECGSKDMAQKILAALLSIENWVEDAEKPDFGLFRFMSDRDFRTASGVNTWDGILWYDRDGFGTMMRTLPLCAASEISGVSRIRRRRRLHKAMRNWNRIARDSSYRVDHLLAKARLTP